MTDSGPDRNFKKGSWDMRKTDRRKSKSDKEDPERRVQPRRKGFDEPKAAPARRRPGRPKKG